METKHYIKKEYTNFLDLPLVGENNILYELTSDGNFYRWNSFSSSYSQIGGGGGGSNIYTADGTSTAAARTIKTYGNTASDYYSFQTLAGNSIIKINGDNSIDFGASGVPTKKNHYGNNTQFGDSYYRYVDGTAFMGINYSNGTLGFFNSAGNQNVNIQSYGGSNRGLIEISGDDSFFIMYSSTTTAQVTTSVSGGFYGTYTTYKNYLGVVKAGIYSNGFLAIGAPATFNYNVEVTGSTLHKGAGSTSATYNTIWKNASNAQSLSIQDDGQIEFGTTTNFGTINFYQNSTLPDTIRFFRGASPYAYFNARDYNFSLAGPLGSAGLDGNGGVVNLSSSGAGVDIRTLAGAQKILLNIQGVGDAFLRMKSSAGGPDRTNLYAGNSNFFLDPTGFGAATVGFTNILQVTGASWFNGLVHNVKGSDVASANNLTLTTNSHTITGTTQINAITILPYIAGDHITLVFSAATTVKHNTAGGGGTAVIKLAGSADMTTAADTVLGLYYDGTVFQETFRKFA